jgi:hypothetical protein
MFQFSIKIPWYYIVKCLDKGYWNFKARERFSSLKIIHGGERCTKKEKNNLFRFGQNIYITKIPNIKFGLNMYFSAWKTGLEIEPCFIL